MTVLAAFGDDAASAFALADEAGTARQMDRGVAYVDPRLSTAGVRAIVADVAATAAETGLAAADADAYEAHRLSLALPAPGADLIVDKSILLESNFEELNGVDFSKGCFVGQEVTARTRYRGLIKKRLLAVTFDGPEPPAGTTITLDGRDAGTMYDDQMNVVPMLAESFEQTGPNTWRAVLRKGIKFHNGNEFNADDFIFSWERALSEGSDLKVPAQKIKEIKKIDDYTFDLITHNPNPILPRSLLILYVMA